MNNAFLRYERFERNLNPQLAANTNSPPSSSIQTNNTNSILFNNTHQSTNLNKNKSPVQNAASKTVEDKPLIDFGDTNEFSNRKDSDLLADAFGQIGISNKSHSLTSNSSARNGATATATNGNKNETENDIDEVKKIHIYIYIYIFLN